MEPTTPKHTESKSSSEMEKAVGRRASRVPIEPFSFTPVQVIGPHGGKESGSSSPNEHLKMMSSLEDIMETIHVSSGLDAPLAACESNRLRSHFILLKITLKGLTPLKGSLRDIRKSIGTSEILPVTANKILQV
ncbi:hypothetical protein ACTXT7_007760 [Hymenolepis weldensis]